MFENRRASRLLVCLCLLFVPFAASAAPTRLASITLNPATVNSGNASTGTATLNQAAPKNGAIVTLTSSSPAAQVPASVFIPQGQTTATFGITTTPVGVQTVATITGNYGQAQSATLTMRAPAIWILYPSVDPIEAEISGYGSTTTIHVLLDGIAPAGGVNVPISYSSSAANGPSSLHIPGGATQASFDVTGNAVTSDTLVTITATLNGSGSTSITIKPCWQYVMPPRDYYDYLAPYANDVIWIDDALAPGMSLGSATWDTAFPIIGTQALTQPETTGYQSFVFTDATTTITPNVRETMNLSLVLSRCGTPRQIMVGWHTASGWKKAYYGPALIGGEAAAVNLGPMPIAYGLLDVRVAATALGIAGEAVDGFSVELSNGQVWIDRVGKSCAQLPPANPSIPATDTIWIDDAAPAGSQTMSLTWDDTISASGTRSLVVGGTMPGVYGGWITGGTPALPLTNDQNLVVYALVDSCRPPEEIQIKWATDDGRVKGAYWGAPVIGGEGTTYLAMGSIPAPGQWVRLEVPARQLGMEGRTVNQLYLDVKGGTVWLDAFGVSEPGCVAATAPEPFIPAGETVWFDDVLPAGASFSGDINGYLTGTQHASGTLSAASPWDLTMRWATFHGATDMLQLDPGDSLVAYFMTHECLPPDEVAIYWYPSDGPPGRGVYFGTPNGWGEGWSLTYMGPMPAAGVWTRVEIPAATLGFEGKSIEGASIRVSRGQAFLDRLGKK